MARHNNENGTEGSMLMRDHIGEPSEEEKVVTKNGVRNRAPVADPFQFTDLDRKEFGVEAHETVIWVRDDNLPEWQRKDPGHTRQVRHAYDNQGRVLRDDKNNTARIGGFGLSDLVAMAVPTALIEANEAAHAQSVKDYYQTIGDQKSGHPGQFDKKNESQVEEEAESNKILLERIQQENATPFMSRGMIGNTEGMTYEEALRFIPEAMQEAEAERYRRGERHYVIDDDEFQEMWTGQKPEKPRGKQHAIGAGPAVTPGSSLAQVRNRNQRAQPGARR